MARSISSQADAVTQTLQPYTLAADPFEAFISDAYTARQLDKMNRADISRVLKR